MIQVDISNIWGELSLPDLLGLEADIFTAYRALMAAQAEDCPEPAFSLYSYENPVWLYTAARKLLFRLGRTAERLEYRGQAEAFVSICEALPSSPAGARSFVTLISAGLPEAEVADLAENLSLEGDPVILLDLGAPGSVTAEQLRRFFRLSAALWKELP